jgi:hypothetical protein
VAVPVVLPGMQKRDWSEDPPANLQVQARYSS